MDRWQVLGDIQLYPIGVKSRSQALNRNFQVRHKILHNAFLPCYSLPIYYETEPKKGVKTSTKDEQEYFEIFRWNCRVSFGWAKVISSIRLIWLLLGKYFSAPNYGHLGYPWKYLAKHSSDTLTLCRLGPPVKSYDQISFLPISPLRY